MVCPIGLPCCRSEFGPRITFVSSGPGGLLSCASLSKWALWSITRIPCASPTLGQPQRSDFSRPLCARIARCGFSERSFLPRKCWREDRVNRVRGGRAVEFTTQFDAHAVSGRRRFFFVSILNIPDSVELADWWSLGLERVFFLFPSLYSVCVCPCLSSDSFAHDVQNGGTAHMESTEH